jgi:hypothetical protein
MQQSNFLWDVEPIEEELVSAPNGERVASAEVAEPEDDELMAEARKLDDEPNDTEETEVIPPDEEDALTVEARKLDNEDDELADPKDNAAVACLSTCVHRHVLADQEPCLSCDVTSLSNYCAETDKQADDEDDEDDGSWSSDEPDDS